MKQIFDLKSYMLSSRRYAGYIVIAAYILLIILSTISISWSSTEKFSIIEPLDKTLFESELMAIVIKVNFSELDSIVIKYNNTTKIIPVKKGRKFICKTLTLKYGPNAITVNALVKDKIVESKKIVAFYQSDVSSKFHTHPSEFRIRPFHQKNKESVCRQCHTMNLAENYPKPMKPKDSICYQCHKKITDYKHVHGPAARWDCLTCHNKNSRPIKYLTPKPDSKLCFTCHVASKKEWTRKKYWHGPTATGKCTICHNPHASNNIFWLKKPIWNLCVTCHVDKASGIHVIAAFVFSDKGHPTKGFPDPARPGRRLSCSSCHNPHASNSKYLFVNGSPTTFGLCSHCHHK